MVATHDVEPSCVKYGRDERARHEHVRSGTLLAGLVVALLASLLLLVPEPTNAATDPGRVTPIVAELVPQKTIVPVRGSDGRWHGQSDRQTDIRPVHAVSFRLIPGKLPLDR